MSTTEIVEAQQTQPVEQAPAASQTDVLVNQLATLVLDPRVPMDRIERLWEMKQEEDARIARVEFDNSIALAKAEIRPIEKTASVDYESKRTGEITSYKHETLDGIAAQIDPILARHGLSYRFRSDQNEKGLSVTCIIAHKGGYSEETTLSGPPDTSGQKNAYQAVGSAATYLQRYTLKLALGLAAAKDTDTADHNQEDAAPTITEYQYRELMQTIEETGFDEDKLRKAYRCAPDFMLTEWPVSHFEEAITRMRAYKKKVDERAAKEETNAE